MWTARELKGPARVCLCSWLEVSLVGWETADYYRYWCCNSLFAIRWWVQSSVQCWAQASSYQANIDLLVRHGHEADARVAKCITEFTEAIAVERQRIWATQLRNPLSFLTPRRSSSRHSDNRFRHWVHPVKQSVIWSPQLQISRWTIISNGSKTMFTERCGAFSFSRRYIKRSVLESKV